LLNRASKQWAGSVFGPRCRTQRKKKGIGVADRENGDVVRRRRTIRRVLMWAGSILLVLLICAAIAGEILLHRAEPILKAKVIESLSARFDSRVELDEFHVSLLHRLGVSGEGLRLYPLHIPASAPLFAVKRFSFYTTWKQLLQSPIHIDRVRVSGLEIHMPPKSERSNMPNARPQGSHIKISVGEVVSDDALLVIDTDKPGKVPLQFNIRQLHLSSIRAGQPMQFYAVLINPKPVGNIDTHGEIGPFDEESPADTPVRGEYAFYNADLGPLQGIGGTLSSNGRYEGPLDRITVDGTTTTPNFSLDVPGRPVPLNTKFHAIVDGVNGDTYLQPVDAWLLGSHIVAKGDVVRYPNVPGHDIRLDVTLGPAHIQDVLELAGPHKTPLMTGDMQMHTSFHLPPDHVAVMDRLQLAGAFALKNAHFTSEQFQSKVDELSLRGEGQAKEARQEGKAMQNGGSGSSSEANVASTVRGDFTFGNGKITLKNLEYRVPGADIALDGTYTVSGEQFDFTGAARLDAKISQMVTGWKSLLLKPVDPFFSKHGQTVVPIRITGTRTSPHIGLDFGHHEHDENAGRSEAPKK
jgi:hypothetical protein